MNRVSNQLDNAINASEARIESPCVRQCCLNADDICLGCFRSLTEICQWSNCNQQAQRTILKNAEQRHASYLNLYPDFRSNNTATDK